MSLVCIDIQKTGINVYKYVYIALHIYNICTYNFYPIRYYYHQYHLPDYTLKVYPQMLA